MHFNANVITTQAKWFYHASSKCYGCTVSSTVCVWVSVCVCLLSCVRETETRSQHRGDSSAGGNSTALGIIYNLRSWAPPPGWFSFLQNQFWSPRVMQTWKLPGRSVNNQSRWQDKTGLDQWPFVSVLPWERRCLCTYMSGIITGQNLTPNGSPHATTPTGSPTHTHTHLGLKASQKERVVSHNCCEILPPSSLSLSLSQLSTMWSGCVLRCRTLRTLTHAASPTRKVTLTAHNCTN